MHVENKAAEGSLSSGLDTRYEKTSSPGLSRAGPVGFILQMATSSTQGKGMPVPLSQE